MKYVSPDIELIAIKNETAVAGPSQGGHAGDDGADI